MPSLRSCALYICGRRGAVYSVSRCGHRAYQDRPEERLQPVHPADQHLLGVNWDDAVWVDLRLPFGLRSAPKIFTAFADAVAWSLHVAGVEFLIHYLDDFLIFCPPGRPDISNRTLCLALRTLSYLQIPVANHISGLRV